MHKPRFGVHRGQGKARQDRMCVLAGHAAAGGEKRREFGVRLRASREHRGKGGI